METKYYKHVKWLEPFIQKAKGLAPIHKLSIVKGFSIPFSLGQEMTNASCITFDHKTYTLAVRTHNQVFQLNKNGTFSGKKHMRRPIYDILGDVAHELAHLVCWEHAPEHWELECKIQRRFISELKRRGVTDVTTRRVKDILDFRNL